MSDFTPDEIKYIQRKSKLYNDDTIQDVKKYCSADKWEKVLGDCNAQNKSYDG
ncbi:MAG: hypothetical protein MJ197_08710 [Bacteroidales bacterium]|nr:hypothetical protein [Bacteroidales bacterium]